jgi:hypothetical protein
MGDFPNFAGKNPEYVSGFGEACRWDGPGVSGRLLEVAVKKLGISLSF